MIEGLNFDKLNGLIPAVIQDPNDGTVFMIGFMNREALRRTLSERRVTFWSRTKKRLWQKGETSGNYLNVLSVTADCDQDSILILAKPEGPVCHRGTRSCFGEVSFAKEDGIKQLSGIIESRKQQMPEDSYTAKLLQKGLQKIGQKIGEEAVELAIAAQYPDQQRCIEEAADVLYHLLVLLAAKEISLAEVEAELAGRRK